MILLALMVDRVVVFCFKLLIEFRVSEIKSIVS